MKELILLLVAIYSLIIHQSHKANKGKISRDNIAMVKKATYASPIFSRSKIILPARPPDFASYLSSSLILPKERKKNKYKNIF